MKKQLFLSIFAVSSIIAIQADYYTREINIADDYEVSQAAQLLIGDNKRVYDTETKAYRDKTENELQKDFLTAKIQVIESQGQNQHIFVCLSNKDGRLTGILYCKYGHRRKSDSDMVEILQMKSYKDQSWINSINFWSTDNSNDVILSMMQYAEHFYKKLSMKSIIKIFFNKDEKIYLNQGYRILTKEEANKVLLLSEVVGTIMGSFLVGILVPIVTFGFCNADKVVTDSLNSLCIYYKEL